MQRLLTVRSEERWNLSRANSPEAAYFTPLEGKRGGMIFFDMTDPSQIVESVEPFFLGLSASIELVPVMNADDLRKGLAKAAGK
jgi:hypothetical protein